MKLILDTGTFLWLASAEHRLSATAVELIRDPDRWSMLCRAGLGEESPQWPGAPLPGNLTGTIGTIGDRPRLR